MTIRVHIENLVLEGLPIDGRQAVQVRRAVEVELQRRLAEQGVAPGLRMQGTLDSLPGGSISIAGTPSPVSLGGKIAQAVHRSLGS